MPFTAAKFTDVCQSCGHQIVAGDMVGTGTYGPFCEDCYNEKEF